jgi:HAE1 family hydrophobic/amphiphilic exporter-1
MNKEQEVLDSNIKENWFARIGVRKPYTVFVCIMAILILGVFAFTTLKTELFPNMNIPYAIVMVKSTGTTDLADTEKIADDMMEQLATVSGIKSIKSMATYYPIPNGGSGAVVLILEYHNEVRVDTSKLLVAFEKVDFANSAKKYKDPYSRPEIHEINPNDMMPVFSFTVPEDFLYKTELKEKLDRTDGVALVSVSDNSTWRNNNPITNFQITKRADAATTDTVANILTELKDFAVKNNLSADFWTLVSNQANYINGSLGTVGENLIIGGILAILILFLFLRSVKMTLAIGISIPLAVVATFVAMHFIGIGLNIVSMSGLALAVGMLVDNSVVVLENIYRLRSKGLPIKEAAIKGASQIMTAMLAATLTTICVFFPMFFLTGLIMQIFIDLIWVVILSLSCSLLVAAMFLPGIISSFKIDIKHAKQTAAGEAAAEAKSVTNTKRKSTGVIPSRPNIFVRFWNGMKGIYGKALDFAINKKWWTVGLAFLLFVGTALLLLINGFILMPSTDEGTFKITVATDTGFTTYANSDSLEKELYNVVAESLGDTLDSCLISYPGTSGGLNFISLLNGGSSGISISVTLNENRTITTDDAMNLVFNKVKDFAGAKQGILGDVSSSVSAITSGLVDSDVTVTFAANSNNDFTSVVDAIEDKLKVAGAADVRNNYSPTMIQKIDKKVAITFTVKIAEDAKISDVQFSVDKEVAEMMSSGGILHGKGITVIEDGFSVQMGDTYSSLGIAIAVGLVLIYLVMVAVFQSFIMPAVVLICVPLAFAGAFIGLAICGMPLSMPALIGFLVLMGVIVNNGILAVDYTNQARRNGLPVRDALVAAMHTRIRPIFMTAVTTILGLLPMALGISLFGVTATGATLMQPLAVVSIGGLLFGTLTTLLVVPAFYAIFCKDKKHIDNVCEPKSQPVGQTAS